jgi:hypothetical protein
VFTTFVALCTGLLRAVARTGGKPMPIDWDPGWHKDGMDYWITFDVSLFAAEGLRRLEDYLLIHAAFTAEWPEKETP